MCGHEVMGDSYLILSPDLRTELAQQQKGCVTDDDGMRRTLPVKLVEQLPFVLNALGDSLGYEIAAFGDNCELGSGGYARQSFVCLLAVTSPS